MLRREQGGTPSVLSLITLIIASFVVFSPAAHGDERADCRELGFTGLQLCSDCDTLATYVSDTELVEECRQCCTADVKPEAQLFQTAVLEAFLDRIGIYPHVEMFVKEKAEKYHPQLTVKDRLGVAPRLLMRRATGSKEVIRIDGWKTEQIEEFLDNKLVTSPAQGRRPQRPPDDQTAGSTREKLTE